MGDCHFSFWVGGRVSSECEVIDVSAVMTAMSCSQRFIHHLVVKCFLLCHFQYCRPSPLVISSFFKSLTQVLNARFHFFTEHLHLFKRAFVVCVCLSEKTILLLEQIFKFPFKILQFECKRFYSFFVFHSDTQQLTSLKPWTIFNYAVFFSIIGRRIMKGNVIHHIHMQHQLA